MGTPYQKSGQDILFVDVPDWATSFDLVSDMNEVRPDPGAGQGNNGERFSPIVAVSFGRRGYKKRQPPEGMDPPTESQVGRVQFFNRGCETTKPVQIGRTWSRYTFWLLQLSAFKETADTVPSITYEVRRTHGHTLTETADTGVIVLANGFNAPPATTNGFICTVAAFPATQIEFWARIANGQAPIKIAVGVQVDYGYINEITHGTIVV